MLYFAYGSNLDPEHLRRRCPAAVPLGRALLPGYRIAFRYRSTSFPGGSAADIIADPGAEVWGALYELTDEDFRSLDGFEDTEEGGYRRIRVKVTCEEGPRQAWSYEVLDRLPSDFRPVCAYLQLILNGARSHGLPESYVEELSRLATGSPPLPV